MKKNRLFEKDIKKSLLLKVFPTGVFSILLGIFIMLTSMGVAKAMGLGDGDPVKKNVQNTVHTVSSFMRDNNLLRASTGEPREASIKAFPPESVEKLGKQGFIFPYDEKIANTNGDLLYEERNFSYFALESSDDPGTNKEINEGQLEKNLVVDRHPNEDGTVSWTVTFFPTGQIYNKPGVPDRHHDLEHAIMGVTFTKDISVVGTINIKAYNTDNNTELSSNDVSPGDKDNIHRINDVIEHGEYTTDYARTQKLFFGNYNGKKDPINLRAGNLNVITKDELAKSFDKSIVFESPKTGKTKYVLTFKTQEDYSKHYTLNVREQDAATIITERPKHISGVMAGIGSYQDFRTVSGVEFYGKRMSDKFIYTTTVDVKETFLTEENNAPDRQVTINKAITKLFSGGNPKDIVYSVPITKEENLKATSLGNPKVITTKYTMVDYEKYYYNEQDLHQKNESYKHTGPKNAEALTATMSKIEGYTTKIDATQSPAPRHQVIPITHTQDGYSPEKKVKYDLDELTTELKAYINDYPTGVGVANVTKSDAENLDNVPTQEQLDELAKKQKEIQAKIDAINDYIDQNGTALASQKNELEKIIGGYQAALNGLNTDTPNDYKPTYDEIQGLGEGTINSPSGESYNSIVKELNTLAKNKVDENTQFSGSGDDTVFAYLRKAGSVKNSSRYKDATPEKQKVFNEAYADILKIYKQKDGKTNLPTMLAAKRALNKAIIELDRIDVPAPVLSTPSAGETTVTASVPEGAQEGDVIKVYKVNENGAKTLAGSYPLKASDIGKDKTVNVPVSADQTLAEGDKLDATINRGDKSSVYSDTVTVKEVTVYSPQLTAPNEGDSSVTTTIPDGAKAGDVIKVYKVVDGEKTEIGTYTLKETDLSKPNVEVPLNEGQTLTQGEELKATSSRGDKVSKDSDSVFVQGAPVCTQEPAKGDALNTLVGISTLNRGNGDWDLKGLGAYIALESNTKGFVITRNANPESNIANPIEGMIVWDTTAKCLKLYSDKTGTLQWNCIKQGCNKTK